MAVSAAGESGGGPPIARTGCCPSDTGSLMSLMAGNDLEGVLGRVELAGGRVIMAKTHINDASGNFALFIDSEGNRLALHEGPARSGPAPKAAKAKVKVVKKAAVKKIAAKKVLKTAAKKKR